MGSSHHINVTDCPMRLCAETMWPRVASDDAGGRVPA